MFCPDNRAFYLQPDGVAQKYQAAGDPTEAVVAGASDCVGVGVAVGVAVADGGAGVAVVFCVGFGVSGVFEV